MSSFPRRKKYDTYKVKHQEHLATSEQLWERIAESLKRVEESGLPENELSANLSSTQDLEKGHPFEYSKGLEELEMLEKEYKKRNKEAELEKILEEGEQPPFKFLRRHCDPANSLVEEIRGKKGWRASLGRVLESKWTHLALMLLLVIDIILVGAEFIISSVKCHKTEKILEDIVFHNYSTEDLHLSDDHHKMSAGLIIHKLSIAILVAFLAHLLLLIVAFGRKFFFHFGYLFDLTVISVAVGVEIAYNSDLYSLLIITTFWRVIRIAHGIYMVSEDSFETKAKKLKSLLDLMKRKHNHLLDDFKKSEIILSDLQKENTSFRLQYEISDF